jgi:hypothetical protein
MEKIGNESDDSVQEAGFDEDSNMDLNDEIMNDNVSIESGSSVEVDENSKSFDDDIIEDDSSNAKRPNKMKGKSKRFDDETSSEEHSRFDEDF